MATIQEFEQIISLNPIDNEKAIEIIKNNPNVLLEKVGEYELAYSLLDGASLISFYSSDEILKYVLDNHSDILNKSGIFFDILTNNNTKILDLILAHPKYQSFDIDSTLRDESFISIAIKNNWPIEYIKKFKDLGSDILRDNNLKENAFTSCIEKGDINIFNLLNDKELIENHRTNNLNVDNLILKSISSNNNPVFEALLPHTSISIDDLFKEAVASRKTQILNTIIWDNNFLPGTEQLNALTKTVTYYYEDDLDHSCSINLIDFLITIKTPFSKFIDEDNNNIWNLAIDNLNEPFIEKLLELPELLNIQDHNGKTPIHYAIFKRNHTIADKILEKNPKLNISDKYDNTPLIEACYHNIPTLIKPLLDKGAYSNHQNKKSESALYWATKYKNFSVVADLLWNGAPLTSNTHAMSVDNGVSFFDNHGNFSKTDDTEQVIINNFSTLVDLGFNLNALNENGEGFPMHFLRNNQFANFSTILNQCHFNPNQTSPVNGNTMLIEATQKFNPAFIISLFKKYKTGIVSDATNNEGKTAIDYAIASHNTNALFHILNYCDDVSDEIALKAFPLLIQSQDFSAESLHNIAEEYNIPIQSIRTLENEDIWFMALKKQSTDDIDYLLENLEDGPSYELKNSNNETFLSILATKDADFIDNIKGTISVKRPKLR